METKQLTNYTLDILDITEFKDYWYEHENTFSGTARNSFLKALDIPPKFFKEQPQDTQDELLENRDTFVRETKRFFNKVIVVLKTSFGDTLNACRMDKAQALSVFEKLKTVEEVTHKFEHRSFTRDGYISIVVSDEKGIQKNKDNQVLVIDFPIMLNKPMEIHKAIYTLPTEDSITPVEHIQYFATEEINFIAGSEYDNAKAAIEDSLDYLKESRSMSEDKNILRELPLVTLALVEGKYISKAAREKVENYISDNIKDGILTTRKLESFILDFDENFTGYKQVTNLRNISGDTVLAILESEEFKELVEEMSDSELATL